MNKPILVVTFLQICSAVACATDHYDFVRISQPEEFRIYATLSEIAGSGHLYVSGVDRREDLEIRVRLFRPRDDNFDLVVAIKGQITGGIPSEKGTCRFTFDFKGEDPLNDGTYLLEVECADTSPRVPKRVGSASQFLRVGNPSPTDPTTALDNQPPARNQDEKQDDRIKDDKLIRIFVPQENVNYGSGANIAGMGYFYAPGVDPGDIIVRIHFFQAHEGAFELIQSNDGEVNPHPLPESPGTCQFLLNLPRFAPRRPGRYLLRVDCLDVSAAETKLIATTSRFVTVVK
jgi:hypothetical protein